MERYLIPVVGGDPRTYTSPFESVAPSASPNSLRNTGRQRPIPIGASGPWVIETISTIIKSTTKDLSKDVDEKEGLLLIILPDF
jgi:hypothetical protein